MFDVQLASTFQAWLHGLRDMKGRVAIARRLERAVAGNLGDHHSVGEGVSEMRIDMGPGYRVYFTLRGNQLVIVLAGGDKSSQSRDIKRAQELAKEY